MHVFHLSSAEETHALGHALGRVARAGVVVALHGELGAGKTTFSQGVGHGLGVKKPIVSPTFILMTEYDDGRLPMLHADAYRLDAHEVPDMGLDEALEVWAGVALVEWASRVSEPLPAEYLSIHFRHTGAGRTAEVHAKGDLHSAVMTDWTQQYGV